LKSQKIGKLNIDTLIHEKKPDQKISLTCLKISGKLFCSVLYFTVLYCHVQHEVQEDAADGERHEDDSHRDEGPGLHDHHQVNST